MALPPDPADRVTLSLAQGRLITGQEDPDRSLQGYTVPVSGTSPPNQNPDWSCAEAADPRLCTPRKELPGWTVPTGDGRIVSLSSKGAGVCGSLCGVVVNVRETRPGGTVRQVPLPGTDEMQPYLIKSVSGRYVLFTVTEKNTSRLLVADIDAGKVLDYKPSRPRPCGAPPSGSATGRRARRSPPTCGPAGSPSARRSARPAARTRSR
ncbi:hypothetical protein WKI68_23970 [Streptomyces sp. MS1.HAVA.3]|uniref:Uncharacterized protein n=1 Tax=Streptomyces caledonius TaxID=3134107 RepID=A0ABU8U6T9_9ACTN